MKGEASRFIDSSQPSAGQHPPVTPVRLPATVTWIFWAAASRTMEATSSVDVGLNSRSGFPCQPEASVMGMGAKSPGWGPGPRVWGPALHLDLENYRHDERAALGLLVDVALQFGADLF